MRTVDHEYREAVLKNIYKELLWSTLSFFNRKAIKQIKMTLKGYSLVFPDVLSVLNV